MWPSNYKYIPSFGDRPNEVGIVVKCKLFKTFDDNSMELSIDRFQRNIQKRSSPEARPVYIFPTTLTVIFSESYLFMTRS